MPLGTENEARVDEPIYGGEFRQPSSRVQELHFCGVRGLCVQSRLSHQNLMCLLGQT